MSRKKRNWIIAIFYLVNLAVIFPVLLFAEINSSVSLFLALYLIILTSVVSYMLAHGKKQK